MHKTDRHSPAEKGIRKDERLAFDAVFKEELAEVARRRARETGKKTSDRIGQAGLSSHSCSRNLFGVALSGGGIRSATFNLGIIQALARCKMLNRIDYLSVNSGGGYIGGWLAAWIKRDGIDHVQTRLGHLTREESAEFPRSDDDPTTRQQALSNGSDDNTHPLVSRLLNFAVEGIQHLRRAAAEEPARETSQTIEPEPHPISHLRRYTNYLTPKVGLFSIDTWVLVATYFRNFLLNLVVIGLASSALIYFVRSVAQFSQPVAASDSSMPILVTAATLIFLLALSAFAHLTRPSLIPSPPPRADDDDTQKQEDQVDNKTQDERQHLFSSAADHFFTNPHLFIVAPAFTVSVLIAKLDQGPFEAILKAETERLNLWTDNQHGALGVYLIAMWFVLSVLIFFRHIRSPALNGEHGSQSALFIRFKTTVLIVFITLGTAIVSGAAIHYILKFLQDVLPHGAGGIDASLRLVFGAPIVVAAILVVNIAFIGFSGRLLTEQQRQWWSRLGAWLLIYSLIWMALIAIVDLSPRLINEQMIGGFSVTAILLGWSALSAAGAYSGHRLEAYQEAAGIAKRLFMQAAPLIFIVGLLVFNANVAPSVINTFSSRYFEGNVLVETVRSDAAIGPLFVGLLLLALTYLLSSRIDVNQFSMHNFYRARLVRAFLGASRGDRDSDPFTDFSQRDDFPLKSLAFNPSEDDGDRYDGPVPIYNCSLNLVASDRLALQERKADSFTFTPYHFGYYYRPTTPSKHKVKYMGDEEIYVSVSESSYRRTEDFGGEITAGLAMAVSGAAISPNMGFRSTSALAFLLTVFNVRLGAWIINPRKRTRTHRLTPRLGFASLLGELFARTHEDTDFVYLSDGGHFENLAAYELIRRRCRYIIVSDAAADPKYAFLDLGNLIRKCRSDFGVNIEIDLAEISPDANGISKSHFAVGKIRYDLADKKDQLGFLVYIKSSLTGRESVDIAAYQREHPTFPHQSTADQWFTESQFDSYRTLGYQTGMSIFNFLDIDEISTTPLENLFSQLRHAGYPTSSRILEYFTNHADKLQELLGDLSGDPKLEFLDRQLFPDSYRFGRELGVLKKTIPDDMDDFRRGFYYCNRLLQLMENVFIDLNLEHEWQHPDNRGWLNLFNYWTSSDMLRLTWSISASTYGARFQRFCRKQFELDVGSIHVERTYIADMNANEISNIKLKSGKTTLKERDRIKRLIEYRESIDHDGRLKYFWWFVVDIAIELAESEGDESEYSLPCGFAITDSNDSLVYMRIRDHLRGLGLARKSLEKLQEQDELPAKMATEATPMYEKFARDTERGRYFELLLYSLASFETPAENGAG